MVRSDTTVAANLAWPSKEKVKFAQSMEGLFLLNQGNPNTIWAAGWSLVINNSSVDLVPSSKYKVVINL